MEEIKTIEEVKQAANNFVKAAHAGQEKQQEMLKSVLDEIEMINPQVGGFEEIASLLAMEEEQFLLVSEVFLNELQKSFNNVNDQMIMVQAMNIAGVKVEDVKAEYESLCRCIDEELKDLLSAPKRSFLKRLMGMSYNAICESEGASKRFVNIPIEFCREGAKMPAYANLTDAGMDLYATEEIVINPGETKLIPTGIKTALPNGYALLVHPRSGLSLRTKLRVCNSIGLIDAGYRDEIGVIMENTDPAIKDISYSFTDEGKIVIDSILHGSPITIDKGERFAQLRLVEVPKAVFFEVEGVQNIGDNRQSGFGGTGQF